ncbi:MAG: ABC transporter substrate-binding protein, partial [Halanaerobiaceae bacterium]
KKIDTQIVSDREVLNGKIMSGDVDYAGFETDIRNYPMFKNYEDEGGYNTLTWTSGMSSDVIYMVNQTIEDENLREVFQDVKFRKALSLAIDRDEINESIYFGRGEATQYTVLESTSYYESEYTEAYTDFDPDKAAELLDEIGLTDQNGDGWRELPNGDKFTFTIEFYPSETPKTPNVELVLEHWKDVGIDVNSRPISGELQNQRAPANMMDATLWHGDKASDILFPVANNLIIPKAPGWDASQWVEWGRWVNTNGEEGEEPSSEVKQLGEWYDEMLVEPDEDKRIELGKKILESQAENLWVIGTVGKAPYVVIASDNLNNVPDDGLWCWDTLWSMSRNPSSFYFEGGKN